MGQTIFNIGCWLIGTSTGLRPCNGVADVNLNQLGLNLILFPYLASKILVAVVRKKDSRLDQGEEGQGIFFQLVLCDMVCLGIAVQNWAEMRFSFINFLKKFSIVGYFTLCLKC